MEKVIQFAALISLMCITLAACHSAEKSAAMVLDNAGSVVRTADGKLWVDSDTKPTPTPDKY